MNLTRTLFALTLFISLSALSQETKHVESKLSVKAAPSTIDVMHERMTSAANQYRAYAPVPRVAFFDIALPADSSDFYALSGNAVILITALVQDTTELPLKRVAVRSKSRTAESKLLFGLRSEVSSEDEVVRTTLGKNRSDYFYLLPLSLKKGGNELVIDFAAHRNNFRIGVFDDGLPKQIAGIASAEASSSEPQINEVLKFILREYPGIMSLGKK